MKEIEFGIPLKSKVAFALYLLVDPLFCIAKVGMISYLCVTSPFASISATSTLSVCMDSQNSLIMQLTQVWPCTEMIAFVCGMKSAKTWHHPSRIVRGWKKWPQAVPKDLQIDKDGHALYERKAK